MNSPSLRLALGGSGRFIENFSRKQEWDVYGDTVKPSLLFSYAYEKVWIKSLLPGSNVSLRNYVLDSGAFTAHSSGKPIEVQTFLDAVKRYRDMGIVPVEIFSLDVIGDWKGTKANTEFLWKNGVHAIPAFHHGEPEDVLKGYAKDYPKIALGGAVGLPPKEKKRWVQQCFARVWPKPIHGFGFGPWALREFPFHSIDCSDWEGSAARFGRWDSFGGTNIGISGSDLIDNLGCEVQGWLEKEWRARKVWAQEFKRHNWPENFS